MARPEFFDPAGIEIRQPHARHLASLEGRRIGMLTNEQQQACFPMPVIVRGALYSCDCCLPPAAGQY